MSAQTHRFLQAFAGIAVALGVIVGADTALQHHGWTEFISEYGHVDHNQSFSAPHVEEQIDSLRSAHVTSTIWNEENAADLPLTLFAQFSGAEAPRSSLPNAFEQEVLAIPESCEQVAVSDSVVCYVLPMDTASARDVIHVGLKDKGWQLLIADTSARVSTQSKDDTESMVDVKSLDDTGCAAAAHSRSDAEPRTTEQAAITHDAFYKQDGRYRWVSVAIYQGPSSSTCVFTTQQQEDVL